MSEELRKLEELFQMGFIPAAEYEARKAALQCCNIQSQQQDGVEENSNSNTNEGSSNKAISLDLTGESDLITAFREKQLCHPNLYMIALHQNSPPVVENEHTLYLHCPKNALAWVLQQQEIPEEDVQVIVDICSSYPDSLHFAFSSLELAKFENSIYVFLPYKQDEKVAADVVIPYGPTLLDPTNTHLFQMLNIATKISKGQIEVLRSSVVVEKGEFVGETAERVLGLLGITRVYKNDLVFVVQNGSFVPARYATRTVENGVNEAHANFAALATSINYPTEFRVSHIIREAFYNLACFCTGISDDMLFDQLDKDYVSTFTTYGEDARKDRERQRELDEIERLQKPLIKQMEEDIDKTKKNIELFESEYKDMKSNFEDQDFTFKGSRLTALPLYEKILIEPGNKRKVPVLLELKIGQTPKDLERVPFNLAIVLDRSGSMQGSKLDGCKLAINNIIGSMNDEDVLHLIMYDDKIDVVFTDGKKDKTEFMQAKVKDVWARNTTNISGGLEKASEVFKQSNCTFHKRTFLFSDGQANAGMTIPSMLFHLTQKMQKEEQIITSTFGIGADFNYEIMDGIARSGHGSYFFIEESHTIPKLVEKGLRGLTSLLATDAFLKVRILQKGVRVSKVFGHQVSLNKEEVEIPVGDIRYGDLKQTLIELEVDSGFASQGTSPVVSFELVYKSQESGQETFLSVGDKIVELPLTFSSSRDEVEQQETNAQVEVVKVIKESAELDELAMSSYKIGNIYKAIECKQKKMEQLQRVSDFDRYGFTRVLLQKTRKSLLEFLLSGLQRRVSEYNSAVQSVNWKYDHQKAQAHYSSTHAGAAKSSALFAKQLEYEMKEEEDDDMGFGLFD